MREVERGVIGGDEGGDKGGRGDREMGEVTEG